MYLDKISTKANEVNPYKIFISMMHEIELGASIEAHLFC